MSSTFTIEKRVVHCGQTSLQERQAILTLAGSPEKFPQGLRLPALPKSMAPKREPKNKVINAYFETSLYSKAEERLQALEYGSWSEYVRALVAMDLESGVEHHPEPSDLPQRGGPRRVVRTCGRCGQPGHNRAGCRKNLSTTSAA